MKPHRVRVKTARGKILSELTFAEEADAFAKMDELETEHYLTGRLVEYTDTRYMR